MYTSLANKAMKLQAKLLRQRYTDNERKDKERTVDLGYYIFKVFEVITSWFERILLYKIIGYIQT